jgi:hypothetical protein
MPKARIFQKPKNAMQSGRAGTNRWVLEFEPQEAKRADPLTGWAGSGDTLAQVTLAFPDPAAALAYCEKHGLTATVIAPPARLLKLQAYADNFR